jgi:protein-arginine kinase activator protein McsA
LNKRTLQSKQKLATHNCKLNFQIYFNCFQNSRRRSNYHHKINSGKQLVVPNNEGREGKTRKERKHKIEIKKPIKQKKQTTKEKRNI